MEIDMTALVFLFAWLIFAIVVAAFTAWCFFG